ncbi:hypothetical protein AURANDRAFT_68045 [Aureococcus anophagefferens]|uniref:Nucleotide-diphospho-sugar transferase domain-containing protein n=1 Tax=Aureococcus anophagefferens TaxID=44056 RepID=F0YNB2_AURAN|nr:hypothetical protein AURANDRAFT_68045 [Aureococcus anophagefferens]EGB03417.1 hypothetical protein AURANDRAFT_68045 [Aureococcus anophagefferens]|eukprot:XP_009041888.1 hypothetical protein AURANDRAFT_68045 [Aureococcus anophagefferens]
MISGYSAKKPGVRAGQTVSHIDSHVAYGERYLELGAATANNKREYARQNQYTFVPMGAQDYETLLMRYCPLIAAEARIADPITGAKFCAMRYALTEQGCDWMLLTDVDSVVIDTSVRIEDLIGGETAFLSTRVAIPDVVWFVNWSLVSEIREETEVEEAGRASIIGGSCGDVVVFAASLNTGAFLMRSSTFTFDLLTHNVLALSSMGPSFLTESACSTAGIGAAEEDQCASNSGVEECSIGCIHRMHPDWLKKAWCLSALPSDAPAAEAAKVRDRLAATAGDTVLSALRLWSGLLESSVREKSVHHHLTISGVLYA